MKRKAAIEREPEKQVDAPPLSLTRKRCPSAKRHMPVVMREIRFEILEDGMVK